MEYYYKVVDKELKSFIAGGILSTEYKVGKSIRANPSLLAYGYGLTVFKDIESAIDFVGGNTMRKLDTDIYLCSVTGIISLPQFRLNPTFVESIEGFKTRIFEDKDGVCLGWPKGTIMAKSVKLIRKIDKEKKNKENYHNELFSTK